MRDVKKTFSMLKMKKKLAFLAGFSGRIRFRLNIIMRHMKLCVIFFKVWILNLNYIHICAGLRDYGKEFS
jgi:hypothetical protein